MKRKIIVCLISIVSIVGITLLLIFTWNKGKENNIISSNVQEQVVEENTKEEVLEEIINVEISTNEENKEQNTNENNIKDTEDGIKNTEDKEIKEEIITKTQQEQVVKNTNTEEKKVANTVKTQEPTKQPQTTKEEVKKENNTANVVKTEEKTTTINQNNNIIQNNNQNINNTSNNNQNEKNNTENINNSTVQPIQKDEKKFVKNAEYIAKMKTYLEKNSKREITIVEDASIIELTTGFTYSEFNLSAYTNKAGIVKIYARDYYVNGQYMYTQCYVL